MPFRNSVLTRLLQDSLGGSAYTLMVCNVAPGQDHYHETLSSLRFAERVKLVTNTVVLNSQELSPSQAKELVSENENLRKRLEELQLQQETVMTAKLTENNEAHERQMARAKKAAQELRAQVARAERQSSTLAELTRATAKHDMRRIRQICARAAEELLECEGGRIFMIDTKSQEIWCPDGSFNRRKPDGEDHQPDDAGEETRVPLDSTRALVCRVATDGETIGLDEEDGAESHSEFNRTVDCLDSTTTTRSVLSMAIRDEDSGDILGVVQMYNKRPAGGSDSCDNESGSAFWTEDDYDTLETLCAHVSMEVQRQVKGVPLGDMGSLLGLGLSTEHTHLSIAALASKHHQQLLDVSTGCDTLRDLASTSESLLQDMLTHIEGNAGDASDDEKTKLACSVFFHTEKGVSMCSDSEAGVTADDGELWDPVSKVRVPKGTGLVGRSARLDRVYNVRDVSVTTRKYYDARVDAVINTHSDIASRSQNNSVLLFPLHWHYNTKKRDSGTAAGAAAKVPEQEHEEDGSADASGTWKAGRRAPLQPPRTSSLGSLSDLGTIGEVDEDGEDEDGRRKSALMSMQSSTDTTSPASDGFVETSVVVAVLRVSRPSPTDGDEDAAGAADGNSSDEDGGRVSEVGPGGFSPVCLDVLKSVKSYMEAGINHCFETFQKEKERLRLLEQAKVVKAQAGKVQAARRASTFRHTNEMLSHKKKFERQLTDVTVSD